MFFVLLCCDVIISGCCGAPWSPVGSSRPVVFCTNVALLLPRGEDVRGVGGASGIPKWQVSPQDYFQRGIVSQSVQLAAYCSTAPPLPSHCSSLAPPLLLASVCWRSRAAQNNNNTRVHYENLSAPILNQCSQIRPESASLLPPSGMM